MITSLIRRVLPVAAIALLLGALVRAQSRPPLAADGYFHLRMGHELLGGWSVRDPGHLGPFDSADWLPTQWLAQTGMAAVEDLAGLAGVMWVAGVLVLALALGTYVGCRVAAAPLPAAFATLLACSAASPGFSARPQVFSYLFALIITVAWLATVRDGRARWWLIPLAWVWAPLHGLWPLSIVIAVAVVTGLAVERRLTPRQLGKLAMIPLLSAVIVMATPLGPGIYDSVLAVGARAEYFAEWEPTDFTKPYAILLLVMFAVVLLVAITRRALSWPLLMIVGLSGALSVTSTRMTTVAALMLAPLVAEAFQELVPRTASIRRLEALTLAAVFTVCAAVLVPVVDAKSDDSIAPGWLDQRLDALPDGSRVLNDWNTGAYFLWRHPQLSLVMHGYGDVFTADELRRNSDIVRLAPGWDDEVARLDADVALVDPDTALGYAMTNDLGWRVVEADEDFALLRPPTD
jgi:hypothetical protein